MNQETVQHRSIPHLLRELRDESTTLFRQEVALARTELNENVSRMGTHLAHLAVGGFVAYAGTIVLLIGIAHLLDTVLVKLGLDPALTVWLAPTAVGLAVALVGWVMFSKAKHALTKDDIAPRQTLASLHADKPWTQEKLQPTP